MAQSGLQYDFWRPGIQKNCPKWRSKCSKNRPKNHSKNLLFFEAGSDAIFVDSSPIYTPKWCLNGAGWVPKSTQKPRLVEKADFRADTAKQRVREESVGFGASIFETPSDHKSMKRRCSRSIAVFVSVFRFGSVLGSILEPKTRLRSLIFETLLGYRKTGSKTMSPGN